MGLPPSDHCHFSARLSRCLRTNLHSDGAGDGRDGREMNGRADSVVGVRADGAGTPPPSAVGRR